MSAILNFIEAHAAAINNDDIKHLVDRGLKLATDFDQRCAAIRDDIRLTPDAKASDLRSAAADEIRRYVGFVDSVAEIEASVARRRAALIPANFDPAEAGIRSEIRAILRGLSAGDHAAMAGDPTTDVRVFEAAIEGLELITGVSSDTRRVMLDALIDRRNPGARAELADLAEQIVWARNIRDVLRDLIHEASGEVARAGFDAFVEANQ